MVGFITMKEIRIVLDENEYDSLKNIKKNRSWKELLLSTLS
jgi:hypothetical protein